MESQSVFEFVAVLLSRFLKLQQALRLNWLGYEEDETHRPTIQLPPTIIFDFLLIVNLPDQSIEKFDLNFSNGL